MLKEPQFWNLDVAKQAAEEWINPEDYAVDTSSINLPKNRLPKKSPYGQRVNPLYLGEIVRNRRYLVAQRDNTKNGIVNELSPRFTPYEPGWSQRKPFVGAIFAGARFARKAAVQIAQVVQLAFA